MPSLAFDTLRLAIELRDKAGLTYPQAEGAAEAIAQAIESHVATKDDIDALKRDLLLAIAEAQMNVIRKMVTMAGLQTLAVIATVLEISRQLK